MGLSIHLEHDIFQCSSQNMTLYYTPIWVKGYDWAEKGYDRVREIFFSLILPWIFESCHADARGYPQHPKSTRGLWCGEGFPPMHTRDMGVCKIFGRGVVKCSLWNIMSKQLKTKRLAGPSVKYCVTIFQIFVTYLYRYLLQTSRFGSLLLLRLSSFLIKKLDTFVQFYQSRLGHLSSNSFT